ncbi:hypothetical protein [Catellatospora sichuanensis]|uniref:hypothetical protein n=1 Tax=Catellatospora sichuanensis TaxID=1969805 RepID=UPI001182BC57|nr:hypothetical protein [Catellatospora sichuanensis]
MAIQAILAYPMQGPAEPDDTQAFTVDPAGLDYSQLYAGLAARTRQAVISAVIDGTICAEAADSVLAEWGLPPLPKLWPVTATVAVGYCRAYHDPAEAGAAVQPFIHASLSQILDLGIAVGYPADIRVTPHSGGPQFTVTATVALTVPVKADDADTALGTARRQLLDQITASRSGLPLFVDIQRASWSCAPPRPTELDLDRDAPTWTPASSEAEVAAEGPSAEPVWYHHRDAADRTRLGLLRRAIRSRVITAVGDDLAHLPDPAARVDRFLADIGLDPLPRAWLVCVNAATTLTLPAAGNDRAQATVQAAFAARTCHERISVDDYFIDAHGQWLDNGLWQATWGETLRVWVRAPDQHTAADAATRLARAHLDALDLPQLHGHRLHVTGAAQTIDPVLDPARD